MAKITAQGGSSFYELWENSFDVGSDVVQLVEDNGRRKSIFFSNLGDVPVIIKGGPNASLDSGVYLPPLGGYREFIDVLHGALPTIPWSAIATTEGGVLYVATVAFA